MDPILTTTVNRPYVIAFLASYIYIAIRTTNLRWAVLYLIAGYTIAFTSEYLSINHGFPYGWYFYKYENLQGEWLNHGVPVWDSVSYVFMCFAGLSMATLVQRPKTKDQTQEKNGPPQLWSLGLGLWSAFFTTILDIIIDPVAHMGSRWFLGDVYYYPDPGFYFDITPANFAGWFLVSFLINAFGILVLRFDKLCSLSRTNNTLGLCLYYGIFGFGLVIAVYLKEWLLVLADLGWLLLTGLLITRPWLFRKSGAIS